MRKMKKNKKIKPIIVSCLIFLVIGYLIYAGLRDTMTYYLTVSEVLAGTMEIGNDPIRVGGVVAPSSVQWDAKDLKLSFTLEEKDSSLTVYYQGVVPDSFKPGIEVVLEGIYSGNGQFRATTIMPKCASKYE
jgi:cytochrome c-type biogenesis protein CcmE